MKRYIISYYYIINYYNLLALTYCNHCNKSLFVSSWLEIFVWFGERSPALLSCREVPSGTICCYTLRFVLADQFVGTCASFLIHHSGIQCSEYSAIFKQIFRYSRICFKENIQHIQEVADLLKRIVASRKSKLFMLEGIFSPARSPTNVHLPLLRDF